MASKGRKSVVLAVEEDSDSSELGELVEDARKGRGASSRRRMTSLYSGDAEGVRRGSVGGMSTLAIETELARFHMFAGCSAELMADLSQAAPSRMVTEGAVLHSRGDHSDALLLVLRGAVKVMAGEECVQELRTGDHLGETLFLGVEDYWPFQLVSSDLSMVCELCRDDLLTILKEHVADKELLSPYLSQPPHVHLLTSERMLQIPLFAKLSEHGWEGFRDTMLRRIFFPGEVLFLEDSPCRDLLLLARGAVSIEIAGRTIRVERRGESLRGLNLREGMEMDMISPEDALHSAIFGDVEFLGLNERRVSTVKADAECHCWVLPHVSLSKAFQQGEPESLLWQLANLATDPQDVEDSRMRVLSIFDEAGCGPDFLQYLEQHFETRIYLQGKTICDFEVPAGTRVMHIVTCGQASTLSEDERSRTLSSNATFGMMQALGVAPRPERVKKVVATEHCSCELLHQSVVVRALELFPDQRMKVLTLANGGQETDLIDLIEKIQTSPFFCNTHPDFVIELTNSAVDRIFMPGDLVVTEGEVGNSMYILLNGSADVYVSNQKEKSERSADAKKEAKKIKQMIRVGHLAAGAIAGELAMLGISQTRSASIQASTMCVFWEVTQERAMTILDRFPEERQLFSSVIVQNLDLTVPGRLMNLPLFKGFDRKFRSLLGLYCERHAYFPEHTATREGESGDKLWIMNSGPVMLQKKGFRVKIYTPGMHFGCENMLGLSSKYIATMVAMTVCHILSLSRASYLHALEQYPSKSAHQKLLKAQKRESSELKDMLDRVAVRKGVWHRYQGELAGAMGMDRLPENELIRRVVKGWHDRVRRVREKRLQDHLRHEEMLVKMEGWRKKLVERKKRVQKKAELKDLVKWNLTERGPLKYMEEEKEMDLVLQKRVERIEAWQDAVDPWADETSWPSSAGRYPTLQDWPQPRPSPHYRLHVWDVVREELRSQDGGSPSLMLPLLGTKGKRDVEQPVTSKETPSPSGNRRRSAAAASKFRTGVKAVLLTRLLSQRPVSEVSGNVTPSPKKAMAVTM